MRILSMITAFIFSCSFQAWSQGTQGFSLSLADSPLPRSNQTEVLAASRDTVWVGTASGLSMTSDGLFWRHFTNTGNFDQKGISAIALNDCILWVASAFSERRDDAVVPMGGGLHWTIDRGNTWTYVPQPTDVGTVDTLLYGVNRIRALAVTVPQQNLTYDIALTDSIVWIASFAGMLRKSEDRGQTWGRVVLPPDNLNSISPNDTLDFDLAPSGGALGLRENLNHRVFAVHASDDSTLWVGTAAGINKSTDGGTSWQRFSHQNQARPISGNFVVAINEQRYGAQRIIWAATVHALDPDEYQAVSFSDDGGRNWEVTLAGERAHNIAFQDSLVYVATDRGVFRSDDRGQTWLRSGSVTDVSNGQRFTSPVIYAVAARGDTIWVGGPEGIAYTIDNSGQLFGTTWRVFRTYDPVGISSTTYSFPLPFSPDAEVVRIHYSTGGLTRPVTIRIFDFAMQPVKTLIQNAVRSGAYEHDEIWDGRDDAGRRVANGVYFYSVDTGMGGPRWGKIFILQ
jgi:ligand-binding sensor domain-containing protein